MNSNTQTQNVEYIRVNSDQFIFFITQVGETPELSEKFILRHVLQQHEGSVCFQLNIADIRPNKVDDLDGVIAIGGDVNTTMDGYSLKGNLKVPLNFTDVGTPFSKEDKIVISNSKLFDTIYHFIKVDGAISNQPQTNHELGIEEQSYTRESYRRGRDNYMETDEVVIGHLDDLIASATKLKGTRDQNMRNDAFVRLRFAMDCLEAIEVRNHAEALDEENWSSDTARERRYNHYQSRRDWRDREDDEEYRGDLRDRSGRDTSYARRGRNAGRGGRDD